MARSKGISTIMMLLLVAVVVLIGVRVYMTYQENQRIAAEEAAANAPLDTTGMYEGWLTSYEEAARESRETGKPIMMVFAGSDWSSESNMLEKIVFRGRDFDGWADEHVVPLVVDFPRHEALPAEQAGRNEELKTQFGVNEEALPVVVFLEPTGEEIGRTGGVDHMARPSAGAWYGGVSGYVETDEPEDTQNAENAEGTETPEASGAPEAPENAAPQTPGTQDPAPQAPDTQTPQGAGPQ